MDGFSIQGFGLFFHSVPAEKRSRNPSSASLFEACCFVLSGQFNSFLLSPSPSSEGWLEWRLLSARWKITQNPENWFSGACTVSCRSQFTLSPAFGARRCDLTRGAQQQWRFQRVSGIPPCTKISSFLTFGAGTGICWWLLKSGWIFQQTAGVAAGGH